GLEQGRDEGPYLVAIVWPDRDVFREGNRDRDLVRHDGDRRRGELEASQEVEDVPIELGDGHRVERQRAAAISARHDRELVPDEVEVDLKRAVTVWHGAGAEPSRSDRETRV